MTNYEKQRQTKVGRCGDGGRWGRDRDRDDGCYKSKTGQETEVMGNSDTFFQTTVVTSFFPQMRTFYPFLHLKMRM